MRIKYIFCLLTTSILAKLSNCGLSTLVTSVVLYSLTRATLMSPGQDETRVCVCVYIYIYGIHFELGFFDSI